VGAAHFASYRDGYAGRSPAAASLSDEVLVRAGRPFPVEPIRTLDAIHLASVELLGEPPQLVTIVTGMRV
jgi:hypothetical protein